MYQLDSTSADAKNLPTMYDLPSEHPEEGLPDEFHIYQPRLLHDTFKPQNYPPEKCFTATDLYLYYDPNHTGWYKRPDWFAAVGVDRLYKKRDLRLSYVIWQEKVNPFLIVELLSPGTEKEDLGQTLRDITQPPTKWEVYEQILQVPYYLLFNRYDDQLIAYQLKSGRYQELNLDQPELWLAEIGLGIKVWHGSYYNITRKWLRFYDAQGNLIPNFEEKAELEKQKAELEKQRAEFEKQRAETAEQELIKLRKLLQQAGINPE